MKHTIPQEVADKLAQLAACFGNMSSLKLNDFCCHPRHELWDSQDENMLLVRQNRKFGSECWMFTCQQKYNQQFNICLNKIWCVDSNRQPATRAVAWTCCGVILTRWHHFLLLTRWTLGHGHCEAPEKWNHSSQTSCPTWNNRWGRGLFLSCSQSAECDGRTLESGLSWKYRFVKKSLWNQQLLHIHT